MGRTHQVVRYFEPYKVIISVQGFMEYLYCQEFIIRLLISIYMSIKYAGHVSEISNIDRVQAGSIIRVQESLGK